MSESDDRFSHLVESKRSRLANLLDEVLRETDRFLADADGDVELSRFSIDADTVKAAAQYLHELGLTADAARLKESSDRLVRLIWDVWLSDLARGKPPESQEWLAEKFGAYPEPAPDAQDHARLQRTRRVQVVGHISVLAEFVRGLREELASPLTVKPKSAAETRTDAGNGQPAEPASDAGADSPTAFMGGAALADALGVHATRRDAFFRQLERQRKSLGDDCWHEVREPRPNSPQFLYLADSPKLRDLAAAYTLPKPA